MQKGIFGIIKKNLFFILLTLASYQSYSQINCPSLNSDGVYEKDSDVVISTYHSSVALTSEYFVTWGEDMGPNGENVVITAVNTASGYNYTGAPIMVAVSGNSDAQAFLLTTDGMYSWGETNEVVGGSIVNDDKFSAMTLPPGVLPADVSDIKANTGVFFLITKAGEVYVTGHGDSSDKLDYVSGDGDSTANTWHQVKNSSTAGDYLTNVVEISGNREVVYVKKADNTIWGWGNGVAVGANAVSTVKTYPTQVTATGLPAGVLLSQISTYSYESSSNLNNTVGLLALGSDGRVYGVGNSGIGKIIDNTNNWISNWTAIAGQSGVGTLSDVVFLTTSDNSEEYPSAGVIISKTASPTNLALVWGYNETYSLGFSSSTSVVQNPIPPGDFNVGTDDPAYLSLGGHATSFLNKAGGGTICFIGHKTDNSTGGASGNGTQFSCFGPGDAAWPSGIELCINQLDAISAANSTITANPTTIAANGTATSTIVVQLYTSGGTLVSTSSGTVVIGTSAGTVGSTTDNGDGTYSATLTAPTNPGSASVSFTLDGTLSSNTATVTFTDATDPTITSSQAFSYVENQAANYTIGTLVASDNVGITAFAITNGNTAGYFAISSAGVISLTATGAGAGAANDFETTPNSFTITVSATDAASNNATETVTINVTNSTNEVSAATSTIAANPSSILANGTATSILTVQLVTEGGTLVSTSSGTVVIGTNAGTVGSTTDNGDGTYSATLTAPTNPGSASVSFTLDGTLSSDKATVIFTDATDPTITSSQAFSYVENQAANYTIGTLVASDNVGITAFAITNGNTAGYFAISSAGVISLTATGAGAGAANDFETTPNSFTITVSATDAASNNATETVTINVTNSTNEVSAATSTIAANPSSILANGTATSILTVQLVTEGGTLVSTSSGTVVIGTNAGTVGSTTDNGDGTYSATLTAPTNPGSASVSFTLDGTLSSNTATVTFTDATDPTITSSQAFSYVENQAANYTIGTLVASDNVGITAFAITNGNTAGYFAISSAGVISLTATGAGTVAANDFETTPNSFTITVSATDAASNNATETVTINVTNSTNEVSAATSTIAANPSSILANGTATSILTVQLVTEGGTLVSTSSGTVVIGTNAGTVGSTTDNGDGTYSATLTAPTNPGSATVSFTLDGTLSSNTATVTFTDATDPTITSSQAFSYVENQAANYTIGTLVASDNVGITAFAITNGNTAGYFAISSAGVISLTATGAGAGAANDFETTPNSFTITVSATDAASNNATETVTINVTDAPNTSPPFLINSGQSFRYYENQSVAYDIGTVATTNRVGAVVFSITNGNSSGFFTISSAGVISLTEVGTGAVASNDYEMTPNRFSIEISATDSTPSTANQTIIIDVLDVDEIVDTDGDGVIDRTEVNDNTDPLNPCEYLPSSITLNQLQNWLDSDCDSDGITNQEELILNTDPIDADSDGDGVLDGTEVEDNTDPLNPCEYLSSSVTLNQSQNWLNSDCDSDGIINQEELNLNTDPFDADSDGDGVLDGTEVYDNTDPNDLCDLILLNVTVPPSEAWLYADCDADGLVNEKEQELETNPINQDSDGDGVLDGVEFEDNTNPLDLCDFVLDNQSIGTSTLWKNTDCDNDGLTNESELVLGTDTNNVDTDGDGVTDATEYNDDTNPLDPCSLLLESQTEISNVMIWNDEDCDGDGLINGSERREDTDSDGLFNFLDPDDDNDGIMTSDEFPNRNGSLTDEEAMDVNDNQVPDYLEANNFDPSETDGIEVYNAVTPNGDGIHDVFTIRNISMFPDNQLQIYNRWGGLVYESKGYGIQDRFFRGESNVGSKVLASGVYYYILSYTDTTGVSRSKQGHLYLNK